MSIAYNQPSAAYSIMRLGKIVAAKRLELLAKLARSSDSVFLVPSSITSACATERSARELSVARTKASISGNIRRR